MDSATSSNYLGVRPAAEITGGPAARLARVSRSRGVFARRRGVARVCGGRVVRSVAWVKGWGGSRYCLLWRPSFPLVEAFFPPMEALFLLLWRSN